MRRFTRVLVFAASLSVGFTACGKGDHAGEEDVRTPPPMPAAGGQGAGAPKAPSAAPAVPVKVAKPVKKTVPVIVDYTGQTVGSETVEIRARVEGFLKSVHFTEGTFVKPGDLLYEIDKDKMQQVVEQAEGERNVAKANLEKADQDVARYKPLVEKNAISREEYETAISAAKAAKAKLDAAEAAVERARINLGYATVKAPVEGLVGKTNVDVGNLVGRGEPTLLTTISKIDPIAVEVRVPETDILRYQRRRREGAERAVNDISLIFSDGSMHPEKGQVSMVDRNIDTKTGTLLVRLSFPNPERAVRPGQFARVQGVRDLIADALLVPQSAVEELQGSFRLMVVDAEGVVRVRTVKAGARQGKLWMIEEGLGADDRVVVEGRQKVRDGSKAAPTELLLDENGDLKEAPGGAPPAGEKPAGTPPAPEGTR